MNIRICTHVKLCATLLLAVMLLLNPCIVSAGAATQNITVNNKSCITSYNIINRPTGNYTISVAGRSLTIDNFPDDTAHKVFYMTVMEQFDESASEQDVLNGKVYVDFLNATSRSVSFNLNSLYPLNLKTNQLDPTKVALPSGSYFISISCGSSLSDEYFMTEVTLAFELSNTGNSGLLTPTFYETNSAKQSIVAGMPKDYFLTYTRYAGAGGDMLSGPELKTVMTLAESIKASAADNSDYSVAHAAYAYLANTLYYDFDNAYDPSAVSDTDIINILKTEKAVCAGFSVVYAAILSALDIPCNIIYGYGIGESDNTDFDPDTAGLLDCNHAWNEVYVNGEWIMVDATWGCGNAYDTDTGTGYMQGEANDLYFDCGLEAFSEMHCTVLPHSPELSYISVSETDTPEDCYFYIPNIGGRINGSAKTVQALGLPETVEKVTPAGTQSVEVSWMLEDHNCEYNPASTTEQNFTVYGLVENGAKQIGCRITVLAEGVFPVPDAPAALTTADILTLTGTAITVKAESGMEYSIDGTNWNTTGVFTGLAPNTDYTVLRRIAPSGQIPASPASKGLTVTTKRGTPPTPAAPSLLKATSTAIALAQHDGYEYKINNGEWQTSASFCNLQPGTAYSFYQRVTESGVYFASEPSAAASFSTAAALDYLAGDVNGDEVVNLMDGVLLARYIAGWSDLSYTAKALNVDGAGAVNLQDVVYLARHIAGWDGYIL